MHPETIMLAAYLDGLLSAEERTELRAHVLTCALCAGRLERLRNDAQRIANRFHAAPVPDIRSAVRVRLHQRQPRIWLVRSAVATVCLMLVMIVGGTLGGRLGRVQEQLFLLDGRREQLVALDAGTGGWRDAVALNARPHSIAYDRERDQLLIRTAAGVVAVDPLTLAVISHWQDPAPGTGLTGGMALDEERGLLYVARPEAGTIALLDAATLVQQGTLAAGPRPGALALLPDGRSLVALDLQEGTLWTVPLPSGSASVWSIGNDTANRRSWLAVDPGDGTVYVMRSVASSGEPAEVWQVDVRKGHVVGPFRIAPSPPLQDLVLIDQKRLGIARGDGAKGSVEIVTTDSFSPTTELDAKEDTHRLVVGNAHTLFGLNWTDNTITRYNPTTGTVNWQIRLEEILPRTAVYVPGHWRW